MDLTFQYKSVCSSEGYDKSSKLVTNLATTNKWYEILNVFWDKFNTFWKPKPKPETRVWSWFQTRNPGLQFGGFLPSLSSIYLYIDKGEAILFLCRQTTATILVLEGWNFDTDPTQYSRLYIVKIFGIGQRVPELGSNFGQILKKIAISR